MELSYIIKQLGKKHSFSEQIITIDYDQNSIDLKNLITLIVKRQVDLYNQKNNISDDEDVTHNPIRNYVDVLTETGKIGFGNIYNESKADHEKAVNNALICFEDGIIAVFQGDEQINRLTDQVDLLRNEPFTFIRLTFLAGSYW